MKNYRLCSFNNYQEQEATVPINNTMLFFLLQVILITLKRKCKYERNIILRHCSFNFSLKRRDKGISIQAQVSKLKFMDKCGEISPRNISLFSLYRNNSMRNSKFAVCLFSAEARNMDFFLN